jgi:hypothetical protein
MAPKAAPTACTFDVRQSIYKAAIVMPAPTTAAQLVAKLVEELPKNFKMPVDKTTACLMTKESWDDKNEAETVVPADTIYEAGFYRLKFPQKPEGSSKGPVTCDFNFENKKGGETRPELIERYGATVQVRFPDADVAQTFINKLLVGLPAGRRRHCRAGAHRAGGAEGDDGFAVPQVRRLLVCHCPAIERRRSGGGGGAGQRRGG